MIVGERRVCRARRVSGTSRALGVVALVALSSGCHFMMVPRGPDPFAGRTAYAVQQVDFAGLMVGNKSEAQYLSRKGDDTATSWEGDKAAIVENVTGAFSAQANRIGLHPAPGPGPDVIVARPSVTWIEPGSFTVFFNLDSEAAMRVVYTDAAGAVLDQTEVRCRVRSDLTNPSSGGRLRSCAHILGQQAANYIALRRRGY